MNIIVIDDDRLVALSLKTILESTGKVTVAAMGESGQQAVELYESLRPDVILMDIRMPEMNGLDATRIIKEINHDIPIIALSAYAYEENVREAKRAGCNEFMAKPFRVENLVDMVKKYLDDD